MGGGCAEAGIGRASASGVERAYLTRVSGSSGSRDLGPSRTRRSNAADAAGSASASLTSNAASLIPPGTSASNESTSAARAR